MNRRISKPKRLGARITDALSELLDAVQSDRPIHDRLTVRTIEVSAPRPYSPKAVRKTRDRLAVSQAVFARLMGVSVELIEHWEQGIASPRRLPDGSSTRSIAIPARSSRVHRRAGSPQTRAAG